MSYFNFALFAEHHRITVPHKSQWRTTEPMYGCINGLPHSEGTLRATDGILCYIERGDGSLFLGHIASFVKKRDDSIVVQPEAPKPVRLKKIDKDLMDALLA